MAPKRSSKANNGEGFEIGQAIRIGARGFEPPTPCTPCKCATRLRHAPISILEFVVRGLRFPESVALRILSLEKTTFLEGLAHKSPLLRRVERASFWLPKLCNADYTKGF